MLSIRSNRRQIKAIRANRIESKLPSPKASRKLNSFPTYTSRKPTNKELGLNKAGKPLARMSRKLRKEIGLT